MRSLYFGSSYTVCAKKFRHALRLVQCLPFAVRNSIHKLAEELVRICDVTLVAAQQYLFRCDSAGLIKERRNESDGCRHI